MAPEKTFQLFILEDNNRIRFITYFITENKLIYGATVFKKGTIIMDEKLKSQKIKLIKL